MKTIFRRVTAVLMVLGGFGLMHPAGAQDTIRIGVITSLSGQFADLGTKVGEGIKLYIKLHGDTIAGKKIQLIYRDDTGPNPEVAKRLAQELITRDKVDLLTGFIPTPSALAVVPLATEAKKPMLMIQAATAGITAKSPYAARLSYTLGQVSAPLGEWAARNGIKSVYTIVSDYGPGFDAEAAFSGAYTKNGGKILGGAKAPLANLDFSPFLQRAQDIKPDAIFAFVPAGTSGIAFMKAYADLGLAKAGIKLITTGDILSDSGIDSIGDAALGAISSHHYSAAHDSPQNKAFLKAYADEYGPRERADFLVMQAYDTMAVIYTIASTLNGRIDPDKFMAALKGLKLDSPRGPITIDPQTRDVDQTIYIRRVERRDGHLYNIEFDKIENASK